jgi:hypothetical protein
VFASTISPSGELPNGCAWDGWEERSLITSRHRDARAGVADTVSESPDTIVSTFRYTDARESSDSAFSSPQPVEPSNPYSSPDQESR